MASGLGPVVSVVLFALLGNKWEVSTCTTALSPGASSHGRPPTKFASAVHLVLGAD